MGTELWQGVVQAKAPPPGGALLAFALPGKTNGLTKSERLRLFHQLARKLGYEVRRVTPPPPTTGHPGIRRAIEHIAAHYTEPLKVGAVAKHAGMCPQQFRKRFKQTTGKTFCQYLTLCRIKRAKELLWEPDCKVVTVALDADFQSVPTFYRVFRRHTGHSPTEYRQGLMQSVLPRVRTASKQ